MSSTPTLRHDTVHTRVQAGVLLASIFVVAACAILYQLLIGTASSFFLGNTIRQFSLTIGVFLASIGIGAFLSRFVLDRLVERFILVELLLGLVGAESVPLLYLAFTINPDHCLPVMLALIVVIGSFIGLELPLLTRILEARDASLRTTLANVMSVDYLGALAAALLFPFVLLPLLGVFRASLVVGLVNVAVGVLNLVVVRSALPRWARWKLGLIAMPIMVVLLVELAAADRIEKRLVAALYDLPVVLDQQTKYQRLIITRQRDDVRLWLDNGLQFSSKDEDRYHEALVHPPMAAARDRTRVLVIGGGDGLAVRELLEYDDVREIKLVDIDPEMTRLAREYPLLTGLNRNALSDDRVEVINADAFTWAHKTDQRFGVILCDLPDPKSIELSRLYTQTFYARLHRLLSADGVLTVQASSPYLAKRVFWCIEKTIAATGFETYPYYLWVPSFKAWGFVMATPTDTTPRLDPDALTLGVKTKILTDDFLRRMFHFPKDMTAEAAGEPIEINRLDTHPLVRYYDEDWAAVDE